MRTSQLAATAALALAALAAPLDVQAWVVVRHPVAVVGVVAVATHPVYVAPAPVVVVAAPAPAPAGAPPLTEKVPVNTTMWTLPSGCTPVSASGTSYFLCGPNWLRAVQSDKGTYYAVVAPP
jgi:hypothetical protein